MVSTNVRMLFVAMGFFGTLAAAPALAGSSEAEGIEGSCPSVEDRAQLDGFSAKLAAAPTPEAAKDRALSKIHLGQKAISQAARILPAGEDAEIALATARLDALEAGVRGADTQAEVAAQFSQLGGTGMNCEYSTVEIVVTVIGFILGIIPGIIFLFLFC